MRRSVVICAIETRVSVPWRSKRRRNVPLDEALEVTGEDGRDAVRNRRRARSAQAAMAALPPEQRAVAALVLLDGVSYKEVARVLDIPIGTVTSRLARARSALIAGIEAGEPNLEDMPI